MRTSDAIQVFLKSRQAKALSAESLRWYRGILNNFELFCTELPETPEPIYDFLIQCAAGDERRHGYYRALRAMYNFIDKRLRAFPNPMRYVDPPQRKKKSPRPLTPEEIDQLLAFPHKGKIRAALLFLVDTGCRIGELATLQLNDITETPWGHVARVSGKTGTRQVPISYETYQSLSKCLPLGYTTYRLRRMISLAFQEARVHGSSINLRHSFGTYWEGDELILKHIMGHSHLETTQIYRDLRVKRMCEQHHLYSPLKMILGRTKMLDL